MKILYLFLLCLFALEFSFAQNKVICAIGNEKDSVFFYNVKLRQKINSLQPGMDSSFSAALYQLVYSSCLVEISKNCKIDVSDTILLNESERIDKNTHNPELLNKIKVICKSYPDYANVYLLPDFIIRWLNYNFSWNVEIHKQKGDSTKMIISEILNNHLSFTEVSEKYKLHQKKYSISPQNGLRIMIGSNNGDNDALTGLGGKEQEISNKENYINSINQKNDIITDNIINSVLIRLKVGELYPRPIEFENCFWILRLLDIKDEEYFAEVIEIKKNNSEEWIKEEEKKIQIEILDPYLWDEMVKYMPVVKDKFSSYIKN